MCVCIYLCMFAYIYIYIYVYACVTLALDICCMVSTDSTLVCFRKREDQAECANHPWSYFRYASAEPQYLDSIFPSYLTSFSLLLLSRNVCIYIYIYRNYVWTCGLLLHLLPLFSIRPCFVRKSLAVPRRRSFLLLRDSYSMLVSMDCRVVMSIWTWLCIIHIVVA